MAPPALALMLTPDDFEAAVARAVEPLRQEVARLRADLAREEQLVTVEEAVRRLGVSRRTVYRMIRDGELPSEKVRGARRVRLPPRDA